MNYLHTLYFGLKGAVFIMALPFMTTPDDIKLCLTVGLLSLAVTPIVALLDRAMVRA